MDKNNCQHDWHNNYDCFEDARILDGDMLGIPVICENCGTQGIEWWAFSRVEIKD